MKFIGVMAAAAMALSVPEAANAGTISLGGPLPTFRTASLTDALLGTTGSGNATVTDVETAFGGDWTQVGSVAGSSGTSGLRTSGQLTVNVTAGTWGSKMASGTWSIGAGFAALYQDLAISLHVGNGGARAEPDHFIWLVAKDGAPGAPYSGTWTYDGTGLNGGGLSNLKAYGSNDSTIVVPDPSSVPDGGATLALLGSALMGLGLLRRKMGA